MNTLFKLPRQPYILACSGGPDSMAALAFLRNGKHNFEVAYFHHGTSHGDDALKFICLCCNNLNINLHVGHISREKENRESPEEFFRKERYRFLSSFNKIVITAHHLDDCVETWLFSCINGNPKLIPYETALSLRPFLTTTKVEMMEFANRHGLNWVEDPSNKNVDVPRNCIRHEIMPLVETINPGIRTVIRKKLEQKFEREGLSNV